MPRVLHHKQRQLNSNKSIKIITALRDLLHTQTTLKQPKIKHQKV